jgi:fimbrial chaperone protein
VPDILKRFSFPFLASTAVMACVAGPPAQAASITITPVGVMVTSPEKAGNVSLINNSDSATRVQIRIFRWKQVDGKEVLEQTRDVVASPPVASIPPGAKYTLRLARVAATPVAGEESYRLLIDELPAPIDPKSGASGVQLLLRASIPAFFRTSEAKPDVQWRVWKEGGKLHVAATNRGNRHLKLTEFAVEGPSGPTKMIATGSNAYVLPGSTLTYESASGAPDYPVGTPVTVIAAKGSPDSVRSQTVLAAP